MNMRRTGMALAVAVAVGLIAWLRAGPAPRPAPRPAPPPAVQTPASASPGATATPPARPDRVADLEAAMTRGRERLDRYPAVDWDVDVKADALGPSVDAALTYVRDGIAYEPYSGALRGASGAYAARAGNAVDRALLLARLLARHSVRTRFAIGTLSEEQCRQLFARTFAGTAGVPLAAVPITNGNTLRERVLRRAKHDYGVVRAALGARLPPVTEPTRDRVLREMNPHVWIQADVNGTWIDLDPSFADAAAGRAAATLERTAAELPADLHQRVVIRVVADRISNGTVSSSTLLEVTRNTTDVVDRQISVSHVKPGSSGGIGAAMAGAFGRPAQQPWMPLLWIDGAATFGARLDADASLATEWLEVDLSWPDGRREVSRRALVDRRRGDDLAVAFLAMHNVWFSAGRHNMSQFAVAAWQMAARAAIERAEQFERAADETAPLPLASESPGEVLWPFALPNFAWMVWTDHVVIPLLNDRPDIRLYPDGPRIAIFTAGPQNDDRMTALADLRRDDLRGVAASPDDASVLAEKKLWFGVLQGALEHEAMTEYVTLAGGDASKVESTSSALSGGATLLNQDKGRLVISSAGAQQQGFWWEVMPGSGDTRAIASLGLHGVAGRDLPKVPVKNTGGGGTFGTPEYKKELELAKRAKDNAKKTQKAIEEYQAGLKKPPIESPGAAAPKSGSGGGEMGEYAATLAAGVLYAIAYHVLSQMLVERIEIEIEHAVDWFKAGGFRQVVGGGRGLGHDPLQP